MVQRSLVSSNMMQANVHNTWDASGYQMTAKILNNLGKEYAAFDKQQEEIAFQRLDLEAQKLQDEQLNNIRLANNQDDIPLIAADFAKNLNEQFQEDKWGKRWLQQRGQNFLAANEIDVQRLSKKKQEELTILETNKTLKTFADEIAVSASDKAQALVNQANLMVDTHQFLTPEQKQSTKDNFTRLWIDSMVTHSTDDAINLLSDTNNLQNLTQIERQDYLDKANLLKMAKQNEQLQKESLLQKQQKLENAMKINDLQVGLITGKKGVNDIEQAKISGIFDLEPNDYLSSYRLINKENSLLSDKKTLADVKNKIINGGITPEEIIDLRLSDLLNETDSKELMSLWEKENTRIKAKALKQQKEPTRQEQLNNYLSDIAAVDKGTLNDMQIWQNIALERYDKARGDKLIDRYNKKMATEGKLSESQKANMALSLYSDLENLYSNPMTNIEDYHALNAKIADYMNNRIISPEEGEKMLNVFTISHMNKMQNDLEKYGNNPWIGKDEGFFAIKDWANDIFGKDIKKPKPSEAKEKHRQYQETMGARAVDKLEIYSIYADALKIIAKANNLESAADILNQDKTTQSKLYGEAVKLTQETWAKKRYKTLNDNINPTAILSKKDGLITVGGNDRGKTLLIDERLMRIAHDPESGKYAAMFKDGTIKEIDYETYKRFSGKPF